MIVNLKIEETPVYGKDYFKGDVGFIHRTGEGADVICKLIAIMGCDPFALVRPNHTVLVVNQDIALETAGLHGNCTQRVEIKTFFDSKDLIIFRRPKGMDESMANEVIKKGMSFIDTKFDLWPIWWIGIEKVLRLENILKHRPVPKLPGHSNLMCSNYIAVIFEHIYQKSNPFKNRHWTKISPYDLWSGDWLEPFPIPLL